MNYSNFTNEELIEEINILKQKINENSNIQFNDSEEAFRLTLSNVSDAVFITDEIGNFTFICPNVNVIFGFSREEVNLKGNIEKILGSRLVNYEELVRCGELQNIEISIVNKYEVNHILLVNVKRVHIGRGRILYTCREITLRKKFEVELEKSNNNIRALSQHLESIREEEKKRIASEIHDQIGYSLTALKLDLSWFKNQIKNMPPNITERADAMMSIIDETIPRIRTICSELRPPMLDHFGIVPAIEWQTKEFEKRTQIKCLLDIPNEDIMLTERDSMMVFRIFQEALTNIARHSECKNVYISFLLANKFYELIISDDGKGITQEQVYSGHSLGILGMRERTYFFNGELTINGMINNGTSVKLKIPIQENSND